MMRIKVTFLYQVYRFVVVLYEISVELYNCAECKERMIY